MAESLRVVSKVKIGPVVLQGSLEVKGLRPEPFAPVPEEFALFEAVKGGADVSSRFRVEEGEKDWQAALPGPTLTVQDLALRRRGEKQPFLELPLLAIAETDIDLGARSLAIGSLSAGGPLTLEPLATMLRLNARELDIVWLQPYFTERLKRARPEASVKGEKLKDLVKRGESAGSVDRVTVSPEEYPKHLKQVCGDGKFFKPRNLIGLAKDLPVPEMETLILSHTTVSDDDLMRLAGDRAQAVKHYLTGPGQVAQERVFVVASVSASQEAKHKAKPSRVDLAVK